MKLRRVLTSTVLAAVAVAGLVAPPAEAATRLGGIDINGYCQATGGSDAQLFSPYNAYSWRCWRKVGQNWFANGMDLNAACRWQYKNSSAFATTSNPSSGYSWSCYRP